jgi:hypothetical protein
MVDRCNCAQVELWPIRNYVPCVRKDHRDQKDLPFVHVLQNDCFVKQGSRGETGPVGNPGKTGANGVDGAVGADGLTGLNGTAGTDGVPGDDGVAAPTGPTMPGEPGAVDTCTVQLTVKVHLATRARLVHRGL